MAATATARRAAPGSDPGMPATSAAEISGVEKAAVLMVSLGTQRSAEVFKHLTRDEVKKLVAGMMALHHVDPDTRAGVLRDFARARAVVTVPAEEPKNFAASLLESTIRAEAVTASYEDLAVLDAAAMREVLARVDRREFCIALKGADDRVKNGVFGNMTLSQANQLKRELEDLGPVKLREIEQSQANIASIIREVKR